MKRLFLLLTVFLNAGILGMSFEQFDACLRSGEIRAVEPLGMEHLFILIIEMDPLPHMPEVEHSVPEVSSQQNDFSIDDNAWDRRRENSQQEYEDSKHEVGNRPYIPPRLRLEVMNPSVLPRWRDRDSLMFRFDMSNDREIARYKQYVERHDAASLAHEIQSLHAQLKNTSFIDMYNRYKLSRRLSFIVKHIDLTMKHLLLTRTTPYLKDAVFSAKQLQKLLYSSDTLTINDQEIILDDQKRTEIMQVARRLIENRHDYRVEREKNPASQGNQLLFSSPVLNEIDLLFADISSNNRSSGRQEAQDAFFESLTHSVNISPQIDPQVISGLRNLQLNDPYFKQYLEATIDKLKEMDAQGLLASTDLTSLDVLKHGTKHYFVSLIPTNPLEHPKEFSINLVKYTALAAIHTATGGALLPIQVAAEIALKLHAIKSADTANMTPKQYAEFIAEELADITYQVAANKLIQVASDRGIPQGFVKMTREMPKGDPEVALAGGGSTSANAVQPERSTTQLFAKKTGGSGGDGAGAARHGAAVGELVANMGELFEKNDFGRVLRRNCVQTNQQCSKMNSQIYKVTEKMPEYGLKKGDQLCLDTRHFDHIEVYNKRDSCVNVLSLNGTKYKHAEKAIGRPLRKK